jgi:hypothetical protein
MVIMFGMEAIPSTDDRDDNQLRVGLVRYLTRFNLRPIPLLLVFSSLQSAGLVTDASREERRVCMNTRWVDI